MFFNIKVYNSEKVVLIRLKCVLRATIMHCKNYVCEELRNFNVTVVYIYALRQIFKACVNQANNLSEQPV